MKRILITAFLLLSSMAGCKSEGDAPAPAATPATTATAGVQLGAGEQERLRALGYLE
jgi:hypothetical protein